MQTHRAKTFDERIGEEETTMEGEWRTGARGNLRSCRKDTAMEMNQ